jgi:hypothetical protein
MYEGFISPRSAFEAPKKGAPRRMADGKKEQQEWRGKYINMKISLLGCICIKNDKKKDFESCAIVLLPPCDSRDGNGKGKQHRQSGKLSGAVQLKPRRGGRAGVSLNLYDSA